MKVTLLDYGVNNILNVYRAFEYLEISVSITNCPSKIKEAGHLVLPGVGAFDKGMSSLQKLNLIDSLMYHSKAGKPLLGICLGMQMLMDSSEEFGWHEGLGLVSGSNRPITATARRKNTHIGWSEVEPNSGSVGWDDTIFSDIASKTPMYFVHSFVATPNDNKNLLAITDYDGLKINAAIGKDNIVGCQFHPEKSGAMGLKVLNNFMKLN